MKATAELFLPEDRRYTAEHVWMQPQGGEAVLGISDFAQDQLGEVLFVDLPREGDVYAAGDIFGSVESIKSVNNLYMPVSGRVTAVNAELEATPALVNTDCYNRGWMIRIVPADANEALLTDAAAYRAGLER